MKTATLFFFLCAVLGVGIAVAPQLDAKVPNQQVVAAYFPRTVVFANVLLTGDYLIVHDDDNADRGDACLFVYRKAGDAPIVAVHCTRVLREKADTFRVVTRQLAAGVKEIQEVQFAGTSVAHRLF